MKNVFDITCDKAGMYLGLQIEKGNNEYFLHQSAYTLKVIEKFKMIECNAVTVPVDPNTVLCASLDTDSQKEITTAPYKEAIGSLMYLSTGTRPDISFAVNRASRFIENPTKLHSNAVKRIIKYIKSTTGYGLLF